MGQRAEEFRAALWVVSWSSLSECQHKSMLSKHFPSGAFASLHAAHRRGCVSFPRRVIQLTRIILSYANIRIRPDSQRSEKVKILMDSSIPKVEIDKWR